MTCKNENATVVPSRAGKEVTTSSTSGFGSNFPTFQPTPRPSSLFQAFPSLSANLSLNELQATMPPLISIEVDSSLEQLVQVEANIRELQQAREADLIQQEREQQRQALLMHLQMQERVELGMALRQARLFEIAKRFADRERVSTFL